MGVLRTAAVEAAPTLVTAVEVVGHPIPLATAAVDSTVAVAGVVVVPTQEAAGSSDMDNSEAANTDSKVVAGIEVAVAAVRARLDLCHSYHRTFPRQLTGHHTWDMEPFAA